VERLQEGRDQTETLLARLRAFCFPGGEEAARLVRGIKAVQRGEFRASPEAKWTPFTAEEIVDATRSGFRWEARIGGAKLGALAVTDAYEQRHGRLVVKLAGAIPLQKLLGPEVDKAELQRYFASVVLCPPMLLNHPSLEWTATGPLTLRVCDRADPTGATLDLEMNEQGQVLAGRAERGRLVGKQSVPTPWSAVCHEFREWDGLRVAARFEAVWHVADTAFTYIRSEVMAFEALR
jgi:hypothetical protein